MKYFFLIIAAVIVLTGHGFAQDSEKKLDKLSADEILSRHLQSLGDPATLAIGSSRIMTGKGTLTSKLGGAFLLEGPAQFASTGRSVLLAFAFQNSSYPYEKAAFDGSSMSYGLPAGRVTALGSYLKAQDAVLKDGLFGGTLSTAWPLLDLTSAPKVKLEYGGTGRIDEKQIYKLKYASSRTGPMKVVLYFDASTFQHLRTEYSYTKEPRIGTSPTDVRSSSRVERYNMTEDFSDFKKAGDLSLPFVYRITISNEGQIESPGGTLVREWLFQIKDVYYDQELTPANFKVA